MTILIQVPIRKSLPPIWIRVNISDTSYNPTHALNKDNWQFFDRYEQTEMDTYMNTCITEKIYTEMYNDLKWIA